MGSLWVIRVINDERRLNGVFSGSCWDQKIVKPDEIFRKLMERVSLSWSDFHVLLFSTLIQESVSVSLLQVSRVHSRFEHEPVSPSLWGIFSHTFCSYCWLLITENRGTTILWCIAAVQAWGPNICRFTLKPSENSTSRNNRTRQTTRKLNL